MKCREKQNNYLLGDETSIKQNQYYKARQLFAYQNSQGEKGNCLKIFWVQTVQTDSTQAQNLEQKHQLWNRLPRWHMNRGQET